MTEVAAAAASNAATAKATASDSPAARQEAESLKETLLNILQDSADSIENSATTQTSVKLIVRASRLSQLNNSRETPTGVDDCELGDSHFLFIICKE